MLCPVCKIRRTMREQKVYGGPLVTVDALLYQYSYPGQPDYISQRCLFCFDKAMKKRGEIKCGLK